MDIIKIAKKLSASTKTTIRKLLQMDIDLQITSSIDDTFVIDYSGPVKLTDDGIIRWSANGVFDVEIIIQGYKGRIIQVMSDEKLKQLCALFNTINGNVNKDTYKKYIIQEN